MVRRVEMPGGVLILRIVTAANMPAFKTETQVDPRVSDSQTLLTAIRTGRDRSYLVKMGTLSSQDRFLSDLLQCFFVNGWLLAFNEQERTE